MAPFANNSQNISQKNALLDTDSILRIVADQYDVGKPENCKLIRAGSNHNYLVITERDCFVLRVYLNGKYYIRGFNDFRFELELLDFLGSKRLPVVRPVVNKSNSWLSTSYFQNSHRSFALFHFLPGVNAEQAVDDELLRRSHVAGIGRTFALIHSCSDGFTSPYHRYHLNLETHLLKEPIEFFEGLFSERGMIDLSFFCEFTKEIRTRFTALQMKAPMYGIIHADLNVGNILFDEEGRYTIIDFDHCAYGWRAYDFAVSAFQNPDMQDEFMEGYETIRPFSTLEKELIPSFAMLGQIWNHYDMAQFSLLRGEELSTSHLQEVKSKLERMV